MGLSVAHGEGHEEFGVAAHFLEFAEQQFHGFHGGNAVHGLAEFPDAVEFIGMEEEFLLACTAFLHIDGGVDAFFGEMAVKVEFHVAGSLEFLEDDLVHLAAGIDKGGGDDGEAGVVFDVTRGAEETFGFMEGVGVNPAGEYLAAMRLEGVVGAGETGDAVEEDDHVLAVFDEAFGLFDDHLGNLDMAFRRFVEGGADDFGVNAALHIGNFLGAFVDEQDDEFDLGVVFPDAVGDLLHKDGFTGTRGGDDEAALSHADRGDEVDHPGGELILRGFEDEAFGGEVWGKVVERDDIAFAFGHIMVDGFDLDHGEEAFLFARRADLSGHEVAGFEGKAPHLGGTEIDVLGTGEVAIVGGTEEAEAVGQDFEVSATVHESAFFGVGLEDLEDKFGFLERADTFDAEFTGHFVEFGHGLGLEFGNIQAGADLVAILLIVAVVIKIIIDIIIGWILLSATNIAFVAAVAAVALVAVVIVVVVIIIVIVVVALFFEIIFGAALEAFALVVVMSHAFSGDIAEGFLERGIGALRGVLGSGCLLLRSRSGGRWGGVVSGHGGEDGGLWFLVPWSGFCGLPCHDRFDGGHGFAFLFASAFFGHVFGSGGGALSGLGSGMDFRAWRLVVVNVLFGGFRFFSWHGQSSVFRLPADIVHIAFFLKKHL